VTDQNSYVTQYGYDYANRLTSVQDPLGNLTQYGYDTENNLASITDASNHETQFAYFDQGWVKTTTFPSGATETYLYDAVGNLTSRTDRKGNVIQFGYDTLNRLKSKSYPDSSSIAYTYDLDGHLTNVVDPTGTYTFSFDNMGRLTGTTTNYAFNSSKTYSNTYGYDAASNRTSFGFSDGTSVTYLYDTLNRLRTLTSSWAGAFSYGYDNLSRVTSLNRPNAVNTSYGYDTLSRLLSVLHKNGSTTLDGDTYTYENAGNRATKYNSLLNATETYTYDKIYEITQVVKGSTTTEQYTYDAVGNRLSALGSSSWAYNSSNQLTSRPGYTYTYDADGNLLTSASSAGTASYTWDFENRMSQAVTAGSNYTITYKYDPFGRRIYRNSPVSGLSYFLYDGANMVAATSGSAGAVSADYVQGPGIDQPLAILRNGVTSFYDLDGLGSMTSVTGTTGAVTYSIAYNTFGYTTYTSGSGSIQERYTAREYESDTYLNYYRARYYDSQTGRFTSEDPIRFNGGINVYDYLANSPLGNGDPSGLQNPAVLDPPVVTPAPNPPVQPPPNQPGTPLWQVCLENPMLCAAVGAAGYLVSPGLAGDPSEEKILSGECKLSNWRCRVRCALINLRTNSAERYIETDGYGRTEGDAFYNGQKQLQNSTPPGFRTKHCHVVGRCQKL
jgi:RHS repeat-associated protein